MMVQLEFSQAVQRPWWLRLLVTLARKTTGKPLLWRSSFEWEQEVLARHLEYVQDAVADIQQKIEDQVLQEYLESVRQH